MTQTEGLPTQPTSTKCNSPDDLKRSGKTSKSRKEKVPDTTFEQLELAWKEADVHKLWAHTPVDVRHEFVEFLLSVRCKSTADISKFIQDVFTGRERIYAQELYAFAESKGITKNTLRRRLKELGYRRGNGQRRGEGGAPWFYRNKNKDWKDEMTIISQEELDAPLAAEREAAVAPEGGLDDIYSKI